MDFSVEVSGHIGRYVELKFMEKTEGKPPDGRKELDNMTKST